MRYTGQVIRPPSEANSYLLQITHGCSWNQGTFCPAYLDKPFKVRPFDEIAEDIRKDFKTGTFILPDEKGLLPRTHAFLQTWFPYTQTIA